MARIEYIPPVKYATGKCGQNAPIAFVHMSQTGRNYITHRPASRYRQKSPGMQAQNDSFSAKSRRISEIMHNPQEYAQVVADFQTQSNYDTIKAYLWAIV